VSLAFGMWKSFIFVFLNVPEIFVFYHKTVLRIGIH